jgi:hypothetical protein
LHIGDRAFGKEALRKLEGYLEWVKERPNARIFLNGDIFNVASRLSPTSPFETDTGEFEKAIDIFKPYAGQIIGATDGNHEARMLDMFGMSPLQSFCREIKIPYCEWSAVVRLKVGRRPNANSRSYYQNYFIYLHHTTGGGGTIGGKMNRVAKLRDIIEGIDVYCGSHNHQLGAVPQEVFYPSMQGGIKKRRIWYVDCGSYLSWEGSYAEKGMMTPAKIGSPRIRFSGQKDHHDCHISL